VVIKHHNFYPRVFDARFESSNPVGLLGIDQDNSGYLRKIDVFQFGDVEIVHGKKITDSLLASSRQDQLGFWKEFARGNHGGKAIEIRVAMCGDDIHTRILAGSFKWRNDCKDSG
jgi:hypothetical protein